MPPVHDPPHPNLPDSAHRVRLEGMDLKAAFPSLRLFESFRMALQPTKLLLALLMLLLIYFGGVALDFIWGTQIGIDGQTYRVFDRTMSDQLAGFAQLINAAVRLDFGFSALVGRFGYGGGGMIGGILTMLVVAPLRLWRDHPWFFVLFGALTLVVKMVLGGAIARLAAEQACLRRTVGVIEAARFTVPRAPWFVIAPLIPLGVAGVLWLIVAVAGFLLFNVPGLNVVGGLMFWAMLAGGFVVACMLVFTALGGGMLPAALAVEGTDAFDAVSRVSAFLVYRPMRYLILLIVTLVYGALTYCIVGLIVLLTLLVTRSAAGVWSDAFNTMLPVPQFGQPLAPLNTSDLSGTDEAASWLIRVWCALLFGVSLAYAISYFFTAQTWMYLLLRKAVDGSAFDECAVDPEPSPRP